MIQLNYWIGLLIRTFRLFISPIIGIVLYFYNTNFLSNLIGIFLYILIINQWLIFNACFITNFENYLLDNRETPFDFLINNGSGIVNFDDKIEFYIHQNKYTIFKHHLTLFNLFNFIFISLFFIKIYYLYENKK
jgi:hypothetical protein